MPLPFCVIHPLAHERYFILRQALFSESAREHFHSAITMLYQLEEQLVCSFLARCDVVLIYPMIVILVEVLDETLMIQTTACYWRRGTFLLLFVAHLVSFNQNENLVDHLDVEVLLVQKVTELRYGDV